MQNMNASIYVTSFSSILYRRNRICEIALKFDLEQTTQSW